MKTTYIHILIHSNYYYKLIALEKRHDLHEEKSVSPDSSAYYFIYLRFVNGGQENVRAFLRDLIEEAPDTFYRVEETQN